MLGGILPSTGQGTRGYEDLALSGTSSAVILSCRYRVFSSHQWDTATGLSASPGESEGSKVCPHHRRMLRAEENSRLIRQGVLSIPCAHCDRQVALAKVRDGRAAECPTCKTRRERRPQDLEYSRRSNEVRAAQRARR